MEPKQFKMQRHEGGTDYFSYPTRFAMRVWFYVRCIGKSVHRAVPPLASQRGRVSSALHEAG